MSVWLVVDFAREEAGRGISQVNVVFQPVLAKTLEALIHWASRLELATPALASTRGSGCMPIYGY